MKRNSLQQTGRLLFLGCIALLAVGACAAPKPQPATVDNVVPVEFGTPVRGVALKVYLERPKFALGENFDLYAVLKNTSDSTIPFRDHSGADFDIVVFDEAGHCVTPVNITPADDPLTKHWETGSIRTWELKSGESATKVFPVSSIVHIKDIGVYYVLAIRRGPHWNDLVISNAFRFEIIAKD